MFLVSELASIVATGFVAVITSVVYLFIEVFAFWNRKLWNALTRKKPRERLVKQMAEARTFEEWKAAGSQLDALLGNDIWRQNPTSKHYDYKLIYNQLCSLRAARESSDPLALVSLLRSGLLRNLGNIGNIALFNRAHVGTKQLIEDYISTVVSSLSHIGTLPPSAGFSAQAKLDFIQDTRQAFGRTTLVLQGGAIFGLYHLGVVKALHLRGLLPRIITGTAVGALMAALVGIHTEDELLRFLTGDGIDLSAFAARKRAGSSKRKLARFWRHGYFLDVGVLEACVRANVGDLTFEQAYARTKRILNITVVAAGRSQVPILLNYLTAPNVLIWSAACASNAPSSPGYDGPNVTLLCKDDKGAVVPWASASGEMVWRPWTAASHDDRDAPSTRIAELFNVNHFVVSQARPYLAPFLTSDLHRHHRRGGGAVRLLGMELKHVLGQLDILGLLPIAIRRFLVDEIIPGASVTVVPDLGWADFEQLLQNPTKEAIEYWILKGEKAIWPAVELIRARCEIEIELDRLYVQVRTGPAVERSGMAPSGMQYASLKRRESE